MLYSLLFTFGALLLAGLVSVLKIGRRSAGLPPGPPTVPILGNMHMLPGRDLHLQYQKWAQEYGPIYSVMLGTKTMIVLSKDEIVKALLDRRSNIYSDRQDHYLGQTVISEGNRMLMMKYGPTHRMVRKLFHSVLSSSKCDKYIEYQQLESKGLLFEMLTQPDRFIDSVRRYSMSVLTSMTFGFRVVTFEDPRLLELFETVEEFMVIVQNAPAALLEVFPTLRWLPDFLFPAQKHARETGRRERVLYRALWQNAKEAAESGKGKPCLSTDMVKVQQDEGFSDDLACYISGSLLEGGTDTTAHTLVGFIQAMLLFPEIQKKAQKHIDQVVGSDRLPVLDDYQNLPYVRSCIKEAVRWMPTAVLGFPHAVSQNDTYLGYRIPKGAGILLNVYTIHMDPERYPNPSQFEPDRHAGDDSSLFESAANADASKRDQFAFGAGRRVCPGMHLAERNMFFFITRLLWAFDITPAKDDNGMDILPDPTKLTQGVVCMPEPYKATIRPRSDKKAEMIRTLWDEAQIDLDPQSKQWK